MQYREKNVEYERDIPTLRATVGGEWKKENELKQLKSEVAALERKIQLELTPPMPEARQEQQTDDGTVQTQSPPTGERATMEPPSDAPNRSQFRRDHVQFVRPRLPGTTGGHDKGIKMQDAIEPQDMR